MPQYKAEIKISERKTNSFGVYQSSVFGSIQNLALSYRSIRDIEFQDEYDAAEDWFIHGLKERILNPNKIKLQVRRHDEWPSKLAHIKNAIEDSKEIINSLENDYEIDQIPVTDSIFNKATEFIKLYSMYMFNSYDIVIDDPEISALKNGSIDIYWNTGRARMLINIRNKTENVAFYYGVLFDQNKQIFDVNGKIPTDQVVDMFADWFSCLSKVES